MIIGTHWRELFISGILALFASSCQMTLGKTSMWLRPGTSVAPRIVDKGDGEPIYMEGLYPKGDSMFIMMRIYPAGEPKKNSPTSSKLRKWPEKIREKFQGRD